MVNKISFENIDEKMSHLQSLINIPSIRPKIYDGDSEYFRLDFIDHPEFGVGFVEEVIGEYELKVFFASGTQIISHRDFLQKKVC